MVLEFYFHFNLFIFDDSRLIQSLLSRVFFVETITVVPMDQAT